MKVVVEWEGYNFNTAIKEVNVIPLYKRCRGDLLIQPVLDL